MSILLTPRLALREMTDNDLDDLAALLGDPDVMRYYPRPYTREQAQGWIDGNRRRYREHGFGLWTMTLRSTGELAGDCGLTIQRVGGADETEVGYHVRAGLQRQGYAAEAAAAARDHARDVLGVRRLVAIIHPLNVPSQRVALGIGLRPERQVAGPAGQDAILWAAALAPAGP